MSKQTMAAAGGSGFLLESRDHPPDEPILSARFEHFEALLFRAPLDDVDIDMAHAPLPHRGTSCLIEIDGVRPDQRAAVIVNHKAVRRPDDLEPRPEREARPIRRGAHHVCTGETRA